MGGREIYYVYVHIDPTTGDPFYVGKGAGGRAWKFNKSSRSKEWRSRYLSHGVEVVLIDECMSEDEAIALEESLIIQMRMDGEGIVNKSSGGQYGATGVVRSIETKMKIRTANGGRDIYCSNGMKFFSSKEAARWITLEHGIECNGSGITQCCKAEKETAYGYAWSYIGVPEMPALYGRELLTKRMIEDRGVKVASSDGVKHQSIRSAVRFMRENGWPSVGQTSIRRAIDNPGKISCGMTWSLVE